MPETQINGTTIFYEVRGSGNEVVAFLNGVAMSTDSWILQTGEFQKKYQVLLHDFRGQGKSDLKPENITFEQHAKDLKVLIDQIGIEKIHLIGVSYGAEVGMHFALMYPNSLCTLVLGTAVSESKPLLKAMVESWILAARTYDPELFFKVMAPLVYSEFFYDQKKDWLDHRAKIFGKNISKKWFDAFIALCENFLTLEITDRLGEIRTPTLVLTGSSDLLKPVFYSELIHQKIPGSKLKIINQAGHALFLEKPFEFNKEIFNFITKNSIIENE